MSKTIHVRDFKGVREITLHPSGSLVVIAGANGAGKSSLIDAITELFDPAGSKLTPKPIREGAEEAVAEYIDEDLDIKVRRVWKQNGTAGTLTVEALDGARYSKPAQMVAQLTGGLIWDPVKFLNLSERDQRDALLAKVDLPFDIDEVAREKAGAEGRRLEAGRDVKRLEGALASLPKPASGPVPAEEVSAQSILDEIRSAQEFERDGQTLRTNLAAAVAEVTAREARVADLAAQLERERQRLAQAESDRAEVARELQHWEETPEAPDMDALRAKLASVEETNAAVRATRDYSRVAADLAAARAAQAAAQKDIDDVEARKAAGLAAASFPVGGLSVDESGVTFEGIPFAQVNSAMRRRVAFAIATAGTSDLRLVIVKDGDLLDGESLAAIRSLADERGFTVLVERDRDESRQIGFTIVDGALGGA